jgi:hypothetical protein
MAELLVNPLVPLDIIVKGIRMTTDPVVGRVLTSDSEGNGSWQVGGGSGPTSSIIDPVTIFGGTANAILGTSGGLDPLITYRNLTDGQLLVGSTGNAPVATTITPGSNIVVTNGPGSVNVSTTSTPDFTSLFVSNGIIAATVDVGGVTQTNYLTVTNSVEADSVITDTVRIIDGAAPGYLLRCVDGLGNASWSSPSSDIVIAAGPSGNLTSTFTAPNTYTVDIKANPVFAGLGVAGNIAAGGLIQATASIESGTFLQAPTLSLQSTPPTNFAVIQAPALAATRQIVIPDTGVSNNIMVLGARQTVQQVGTLFDSVTINSPSGKIFCVAGATLGTGTTQFAVFNSFCKTTSQVFLTSNGPPSGANLYTSGVIIPINDGSFFVQFGAIGGPVTGNFSFSFLII